MDPMAIVNLVTVLGSIVLEIIKAKESGQAPQVGASTAEFLNKLGGVAKIKELQGPDIAQIVPALDDLFGKIHEIVQSKKATPAT